MTGPAGARRTTVLIAGGGTGGHLMPALALADELHRRAEYVEAVIVGADRGIEAALLPARGCRFALLPAEPLYRRQWWRNFRWPVLAWRLLRRAGALLDREAPAAVIGTGGYASAPVVWLAARRGIPTAVQEQNAFPGLATRLLSGRVDHVYLGVPEARAHIRVGRTTQVFDTGNPITPPDPGRRERARSRFGLRDQRPVVLVTGGSQGALAINEAVAGWLDHGGGQGIAVVWATGRGSHSHYARFHRPPDVHVLDFLDPMADGYAVADLVVGRGGMMTFAELCAWGLASILIPLPTSAADHQVQNARGMDRIGATRMLLQEDLTQERLGNEIVRLLQNQEEREGMARRAATRGKPEASRDIVSHILTLFR